ncbi:hypothetical protein GN244_ATG19008 [Phytophthora infestans]|uniref:Uncharacterized protein n=1 Tax=Phytophthora infestans TaxID=4787 RepID=A0A833WD93_PHYIN|nr:hypothetical protein GN244_ATG19008 [Phytophthora infestans]
MWLSAFDLLSCARFFTSCVTLWITPSNMKYDSRHIYSQTHVMLYATALTSCQVSDPSSYVTLLITPTCDNSHRSTAMACGGALLTCWRHAKNARSFPVVRDTVDHDATQPPYYSRDFVMLAPQQQLAFRISQISSTSMTESSFPAKPSTARCLWLCTQQHLTCHVPDSSSYVTLWITPSNMKYDSRHIQPDARDAVRNSIDFLSGVRSFTSYVTLLITPSNVTDNDHRFYGQVLVALYSTAFDLLSCARFFTSYVTLWITKQHEIRQPPYIQPDARDAVRNSIDFLSGVRSFTSYVTLLITPSNVTDNSHRFYGQVLWLCAQQHLTLSCARFFTSYVTLWITPSNMKYDSRHIYSQTHVMLYATA